MKVVIRNEHGQYLRRISPDGTPHFSDAPLDAWHWDWAEEEVADQLKADPRAFWCPMDRRNRFYQIIRPFLCISVQSVLSVFGLFNYIL